TRRPARPTLFPYTTLFRSLEPHAPAAVIDGTRSRDPFDEHVVVVAGRRRDDHEQGALFGLQQQVVDVPHAVARFGLMNRAVVALNGSSDRGILDRRLRRPEYRVFERPDARVHETVDRRLDGGLRDA